MGRQLGLLSESEPPARVPAPPRPRSAPKELPVIGFLFDELAPQIRSKRVKVSAPRELRAGDRPQSLGTARLTRKERQAMRVDEWLLEVEGGVKLGPPPTFGDCPKGGPCVRVGCRHTLLIEIGEPRGRRAPPVKLNHPGREPGDLKETCSLRVAEAADQRRTTKKSFGEPVMSCEEVAELLNLTPERIRQIETEAKAKLKDSLAYLNER